MKKYWAPSLRLTATLRLFVLTTIVFSLFRLVFYLAFYQSAESFHYNEVTKAFLIGLRFDIRLAIVLTLPLFALTLFRPLHWSRSSLHRRIWVWAYTLLYALLALIYVGDIGYYAYLESRINYRIFEFMQNFWISTKMVVQTYNVWIWGLALVLFSLGVHHIFYKKIFIVRPDIKKTKAVLATQSATLTLLVLLGLHNSLDQYPLRWSAAFFSQNMFISSLALNPVHYIFDTAENARRDYDIEKVKEFYSLMSRYLDVKDPTPDKPHFRRPIPLIPKFTTQPNIVYIVMESMAAYKTGTFGNLANPSPSLDRLAENGWHFRHFYTPTEGTARSMFCVLTGIPDINAKSTSSRNPLIVNQHTLFNGLQSHEKYYFIGGSASWGNIRGVYMSNVDGLNLYEEDDLQGPRSDVWGLSDLHLFREAARILTEKSAAAQKPFFALVQSASFHRPYTIPDDRGDFEIKKLAPEELKKYGFSSNEEYNSFRFSDYSLGEFFRLIQDKDFFKNTLFIIHGDHGLPDHNAEHLSEGYKFYGLSRFHTPLVIYSPLIKEPKVFETMMTEPDVMPTVLGLIGQPYTNTALGRNIFALDPQKPNYAFSYVYYTDPLQILLYDQKFLAFGDETEVRSLHLYNSENPREDVKDQYPEKFNEMSHLLKGIFETSKYMLHHNPR